MINRAPRGYLFPSRGLRQGDPLSPYLFLMRAKGLSIAKVERNGVLQGVSVCQNTPPIHHLLFDDDCLIFARARKKDCAAIMNILKFYKIVSGQQVNLHKSAACFSRNVRGHMQDQLATLLGVERVHRHEKYLGLSTFVGRNRGICFTHIKERLWKKLQDWKEKILSAAGNELHVKVVAQAIPLYTMYLLSFPQIFLL